MYIICSGSSGLFTLMLLLYTDKTFGLLTGHTGLDAYTAHLVMCRITTVHKKFAVERELGYSILWKTTPVLIFSVPLELQSSAKSLEHNFQLMKELRSTTFPPL